MSTEVRGRPADLRARSSPFSERQPIGIHVLALVACAAVGVTDVAIFGASGSSILTVALLSSYAVVLLNRPHIPSQLGTRCFGVLVVWAALSAFFHGVDGTSGLQSLLSIACFWLALRVAQMDRQRNPAR